MGLFGALFAGVSGLDSQSNKIGIISNNIANSNTVGFKQGQAAFNTLVVPSGTTNFSPGGVIGNTQNLVNQQGLIQATSSATDIAVSGNGLIAVNTAADNSGSTLFTRAGSFTQDALGNFVNANGYYLQGFQLDASGNPPTNQTFSSLKTVNISASATGTATSTSDITLAANLDATKPILLGSGEVASISASDTANVSNTATQIIVPTSANALIKGDKLTITSNGSTTDTFTYGGFATGRDVTATIDTSAATAGEGDDGTLLDTETIAANGITTNTTVGTANQIAITVANGSDYTTGSYINISGVTAGVANLTPAELNGEWKIASVSGNTVNVTIGTSATSIASTGASAFKFTNRTYPFTGNILDATTPSSAFFNTTSASSFAADALSFQISTNGTVSTFTYAANPSSTGQFNSLNTLASAISNTKGLTASVVNGRLYVSASNADEDVTFINGDVAGNSQGFGINWTQELGLANVAKASTSSPIVNRFNTLSGLADLINTVDPTNLTATVNNPTGASTLNINEANSQQTISFDDGSSNSGSLVNEFSFITKSGGKPSLVSGNSYSTGTLPILYSPTSAATDMASGAVPAQSSYVIPIFDALGNSHNVQMNLAKLGINTWAVEFSVTPVSDVVSPNSDGQIASGTITFNGDGTLNRVTGSIANPVPITWTNGASPSTVDLNLGTSGESNGLSESSAPFNVSVANQNGASVGELTGVSISTQGFVIASFSNGQTQKMFQVPLVNVNNPNGLESVSGDAYTQTLASGVANLALPGTNGVGTFSTSALEQSNVDLSTQLTDLIVAQQAYGANSKVLTIADQLLQQLDQIIQ